MKKLIYLLIGILAILAVLWRFIYLVSKNTTEGLPLLAVTIVFGFIIYYIYKD